MQWDGIGINEDDDEIPYIKGFIENVSYDDVFGKRINLNTQTRKYSSLNSSDSRYSGSEDDEVWEILVTPKPLTVKVANSVAKIKHAKKKIKTIHDYDKTVRNQKRKISDLAIKASTTTKTKKIPINPITVSPTEFGEKRL